MNTNDLVQQARLRFDHEAAKRVLKEKYEAKMLFAYAGGMWRAGPELINVIMACSGTEVVLLDLYENPVKVVRSELCQMATERWQEQMNAWLVEFNELNQKR